MNLDIFNKWATLAANVGVLVGIVFLASELNQNTRATRAEIYQSRAFENADTRISVLQPGQLEEVLFKTDYGNWSDDFEVGTVNELSEIERWRLKQYVEADIRMFDNNLYQCGLGFHDSVFCIANEEAVKSRLDDWEEILEYPINPMFTRILSLKD